MPHLIAVMGQTASGKTEFAETLAARIGAQLVNADAFQVYRGLDIGTAKPQNKEHYKLIDIREPNVGFGVGEWVQLAVAELELCFQKGQAVVIVGGTGFYVRALFEGWSDMHAAPDTNLREALQTRIEAGGVLALYDELRRLDPLAASKVDHNNPHRVRRALERVLSPTKPISFTLPAFKRSKIGIEVDTLTINTRIEERAATMLKSGWIEEVRSLVANGITRKDAGMRAIGYGTVLDLIEGLVELDEALEGIVRLTRQYAKRQRTWLRSEPGLATVPYGSLSAWLDRNF